LRCCFIGFLKKNTIFEPLKRTSSILFLLIFSFNLVSFFFIFKVQQSLVRHEIKQFIKQGVPENELTLITVTSENENQLEWQRNNEFRYKGIMYDIVKKEIVNETTKIFYCVTDTQETKLFVNLEEQVKKNMDTKNNGNNPVKIMFKLMSNMYPHPKKEDWVLFQPKFIIKYEYIFHYSSPGLVIISPPPEIV
jgi:hypothetical protein